jgi:hypothetical protein
VGKIVLRFPWRERIFSSCQTCRARVMPVTTADTKADYGYDAGRVARL